MATRLLLPPLLLLLLLLTCGTDGKKRKKKSQATQEAAVAADGTVRARSLYKEITESEGKVSMAVLQELKAGLAASPRSELWHAALGIATLRSKGKDKNKAKEGARHLREALSINPGFVGLHARLASELQQRTPQDAWTRNEALELYRTATRLEPADPEHYYQARRPLPMAPGWPPPCGHAR